MKENNLPNFLVGTNPEDSKECFTYKSRGLATWLERSTSAFLKFQSSNF